MPRGMDGLVVDRATRVLVGAIAMLAGGCKAKFTGPYACETGYASCLNPEQNSCETDTTSDGLNCGGCGTKCAVGAACLDSTCGPAAAQVAALSGATGIIVRTNSSAVFWSNGSSISSLAMSAAPGTVAKPIATDGFTCGSGGVPFAVDDANAYYITNGTGCSGGGQCNTLVQVSLASGARTVLTTALSTGNAGNVCATLAVGLGAVYALVGTQQANVTTYQLETLQIGASGQNPRTLGTATGTSGSSSLAVNATSVIFGEFQQANRSQSFQIVPLGGGTMTAVDVSSLGFASVFDVDDANIYMINGGCPCNNNGSGNNSNVPLLPTGTITKVPLSGAAPTTLATFEGLAGGIAVDAANVYWSTDTMAWKVPLAGGVATPIAGNLTNGAAAYQCIGCGGFPSSTTIAVGATSLYVAVEAVSESALLGVAK
jgi:hypothetical protein